MFATLANLLLSFSAYCWQLCFTLMVQQQHLLIMLLIGKQLGMSFKTVGAEAQQSMRMQCASVPGREDE